MATAKIKNCVMTSVILTLTAFLLLTPATAAKPKPKPSGIEKMLQQLDQIGRGDDYYSSVWTWYTDKRDNDETKKYSWLLKKLFNRAPKDLASLRAALDNKKLHEQTRAVAAILLAHYGDEKSVDKLIAGFNGSECSYGASYALQIHRAPKITARLNELVFDKKAKCSPFYLVEALARRTEAEALKGLEEVFEQGRRFGGHEVVEAVNGILAQGKRGVPLLIKLFKENNYESYLVARALVNSPVWEGQKTVLQEVKLNKEGKFTPKYADAVRNALPGFTDVRAVGPLCEVLLKHADKYTRADAAKGLGNLNDKRAFTALLKGAEHEDEYMAKTVAVALGHTGYEAGVGDLLRFGRAMFSTMHKNVRKALFESAFRLDRKRVAGAVVYYRKSKSKDDLAFANQIEWDLGRERLAGKVPTDVLAKMKKDLASGSYSKQWEASRKAVHWRTKETGKLLLEYVKSIEPLMVNSDYSDWHKGLGMLLDHGYGPGVGYVKKSVGKMLPYYRVVFERKLHGREG